MKLSIVIPAYNEENRIARTLETYARYCQQEKDTHNIDTELVVVLNGCRDNTLAVVMEKSLQFPIIRCINLTQAGKGLAIAAGFKDALTRENDIIGFVDADMATQPAYFFDLLVNLGEHDGVMASRYMRGAQVYPPRPLVKAWGRKFIYNNLVHLLFGMNYHDLQCGAKLFKRSVIEKIAPHLSVEQWAFDVELLYLGKKHKFSIKEIPTVWHDQAESKLQIMGSGMRMLGSVVKLRMRHSPLLSRFVAQRRI